MSESVESIVILYLIWNASRLRFLSSIFCLIHLSIFLYSIYFLSHLFSISFISYSILFRISYRLISDFFMFLLRLSLNSHAAKAKFHHSDCISNFVSAQATSCNKLYVTKTEMGDSGKIKMYIYRADTLNSIQ